MIDAALSQGRLSPGDASKLAHRLSWGGTHLFKRLGRAMLRPLFDQCSRRDGSLCSELRRALLWWRTVLRTGIAERRPWQHLSAERPLHLFTDASGTPPYLGAVLFDGEVWRFTHMAAPEVITQCFKKRSDNQIMGLELLGISLGLSTFQRQLHGRSVVIHCDNSGAEVCGSYAVVGAVFVAVCGLCCVQVSVSKGSARSWDHAQLVHAQWLHVAREHMQIWVQRVDTAVNIADLPSRRDLHLLRVMGAVEHKPRLESPYSMPEIWEVLQERWSSSDQCRE